MTYTPEKVAELIAEARTALAEDRIAHWVAEGGMESVLDALAAVTAERDAAVGERDERELALSAVPGYTKPKFFMQEFKRVMGDLLKAEAERDAALGVIREARNHIADHWLAPFKPGEGGYRLQQILSRIPEHPTNTEGQADD